MIFIICGFMGRESDVLICLISIHRSSLDLFKGNIYRKLCKTRMSQNLERRYPTSLGDLGTKLKVLFCDHNPMGCMNFHDKEKGWIIVIQRGF